MTYSNSKRRETVLAHTVGKLQREAGRVGLGLFGFTAALAFLLRTGQAVAGSFDDTNYDTNVGFSTPMSTITGLTDWAKDINYVYGITAWITGFIFLAVAIPVVVTIMKFRVKEEDADKVMPKQVHGNAVLEFTWTVVPCILLVLIAVPTWRAIFKQAAEPSPDALQVEVIGHQWWWEFRYPQYGVTTANELSLPENRQVFFKLKSADVIHSFWIPQFGGKVDVLPGNDHINTMLFTTPGLPEEKKDSGLYFQGQCVELCGASHALMRFYVMLRTNEQFERWAKAVKTPPLVATEQQKKGEQAFAQCVACHTINGTPSEQIPGDKIGPNLSNFGSRQYLAGGTRRNTPENLAAWLHDPPAIKPGSLMPNLGLSDGDIAALSAYLRQSTAKTY